MTPTFEQELFHGTSLGRRKQKLSSIRVVKVDFSLGNLGIIDKVGLFKVSAVFGVVTIKITDAIGRVAVASPSEIFLHGYGRGSVGFGGLRIVILGT